MKKLFNSITVELRKTIFSYGFILCIVITGLLCFTSPVYTDSLTGKEYSVFEVIANKSRSVFSSFTSSGILYASVSPYLTLFIPVLSSLPFVTGFCAERLGGNMRFVITRNGKYKYCISKFVSAVLSGGAAVMAGFILFSIAVCFVFSNAELSAVELIKRYIGMGLYGMVSVLPAFFLSAFIKNKYMICCFPFIFMHFYYTTVSKVQDFFNARFRWDIVMKMSFLYPSNIKEILFDFNSGIIIYHVVLAIAALVGFTVIMNRRLDYGQ
ncbi:MAG: hypothetical protein NC177_17855 [Ruminococcus flavefaciens]|nr:hypothetical protein [Ruminococcus flavefaciens]